MYRKLLSLLQRAIARRYASGDATLQRWRFCFARASALQPLAFLQRHRLALRQRALASSATSR